MRLPLESVLSSEESIVWSLMPPPVITRPFIVEEALVALRRVVWIPPEKVVVPAFVKVVRPEKVFESASSVDDANDQVLVENE